MLYKKGQTAKGPFKLRYNFLALFSAGFGAANSLLSIKVLGISVQNDVLYISSLVIITLTMVSAFLTEQFMVFYNEARNQSVESARSFYSAVMTISFITQVFLVVFCFFSMPFLLGLFAKDLDPSRAGILKMALTIQLVGFLFLPANNLNTLVLNSNGRYSFPFILQITQLVMTTFVYGIMAIFGLKSIIPLLFTNVISAFMIFILQAIAVWKSGLHFFPGFRDRRVGSFLLNSFTMRFGHNLNNMLVQPLVSNTISSMPAGYASAYSFSQKFITLLSSIAVGPHQSVLRAEISRKWIEGDISGIRQRIRHFQKATLSLVIPMTIVIYFISPFVLSVFSGGKIGFDDQVLIQNLFLASAVWVVQLLVESPYVQVAIAAKKSLFFIFENSVNFLIILGTIYFLNKPFGLLALPLGFIAGQVWNNVLNIGFASKLMRMKEFCIANETHEKG